MQIKVCFQNMLINAMAESQSMIGLLKITSKVFHPIAAVKSKIFGLSLKASINHKIIIAMKSCMGLQIFFFFRPNAAIEEAITENRTTNLDYSYMDSKLQNSTDIMAGSVLQERQETVFDLQNNMPEK
jgi:hypothetical protein